VTFERRVPGVGALETNKKCISCYWLRRHDTQHNYT